MNENDGSVSSADRTGGTMINRGQWLTHCVEVETESPFYLQENSVYSQARQTILADSMNAVEDENSFYLTQLQVSTNNADAKTATLGDATIVSAFEFDPVRLLELPQEVETYPLVVQVVYLLKEEDKETQKRPHKFFIRVKTDLTVYDGVTGLHTAFMVLEFLNTGRISPYPFRESYHQGSTTTKNNTTLQPDLQLKNFQRQIKIIEDAKFWEKISPARLLGLWRRTPLCMSERTDIERCGRRFKNVECTFKEFIAKLEMTKDLLNIPFVAVTVNFSPSTALSICPSFGKAMNKEERVNHIAFPPVGTGPPAPMNKAHVETLFNTVFFNNYGKHTLPHVSSSTKIVGYVWDWSGMMNNFPPFFHIMQIDGKLFFTFSAAKPDFDRIEKAQIFHGIGETVPFQHRGFYQDGK